MAYRYIYIYVYCFCGRGFDMASRVYGFIRLGRIIGIPKDNHKVGFLVAVPPSDWLLSHGPCLERTFFTIPLPLSPSHSGCTRVSINCGMPLGFLASGFGVGSPPLSCRVEMRGFCISRTSGSQGEGSGTGRSTCWCRG